MILPPSLPQHDPLAHRRSAEVADAQREYVYDRSYEEILYCKEVPTRDKSDARYWLGLGKMGLEVKLNRASSSNSEGRRAELHAHLEKELSKNGPLSFRRVRKAIDDLVPEGEDPFEVHHLEDYDRAYKLLRDPLPKGRWHTDEFFAWQALAGCNPTMIERLTAPLAKLPVTDAHFRAAVGDHDTLERAMSEGRLYVADYWALDGMSGGKTDEHQKYVWAPIALYCQQPARDGRAASFVPVAIQCGQTPGPETPIFTPADGTSWLMARTTVAVADSQDQGLGRHFGCCHMVMQAVTMAMKRQLGIRHPLRILLEPHTENTLIANEICRTQLTNPGGIVDRLQAMELPVSMRYCNDAIARFRLLQSDPVQDCASRRVHDTALLPVYPHRDDQLRLWEAVFAWVDAYVRAYYRDRDDVQNDHELVAFVKELGADDGGRLQGLFIPGTIAELVDLVARIVFRGSAYHASINYSLYDYTYAPSGPTSAFGPGPTGTSADTDAARVAMHPPYDIAYEVVSIYYDLQLRLNRLGQYGSAIMDVHVKEPLERFQHALAQIDEAIRAENKTRFAPYEFSMPSNVTASIHV